MHLYTESGIGSRLPETVDPLLARLLGLEIKLAAPVLAGSGGWVELHETLPDDLVELGWSSDLREWVRASDLDPDGDRLRIPLRGPRSLFAASRSDWELRWVRLLRMPKVPASPSFSERVALWEREAGALGELVELQGAGLAGLSMAGAIRLKGRTLVLLPSLGSLPTLDWAAVAKSEELRALRDSGWERVLGFSCPTLSADPVASARLLISLLPKDSQIDLLVLSGGAILGELLAHPAPTAAESKLLRASGCVPLAESLEALYAEMGQRQLRVGGVARLGCPLRGLDGSLVELLGGVVNLMDFSTELSGTPVHTVALSALLAGLHGGNARSELAGLAALEASSPLLRWLGKPGPAVASSLLNVSAWCRVRGVHRPLSELTTHRIGAEDHDLLVGRTSTLGGFRRMEATPRDNTSGQAGTLRSFWQLDVQDLGIHHYNLLAHAGLRERVLRWLARGETLGLSPMADPWGDEPWKSTRGPSLKDRPLVYFVPDFMASHLRDANGRVWLEPSVLAEGGLSRIQREAVGVEVDGILSQPHRALLHALSARYEVRTFPWDWRLSVRLAADQLAQEIEAGAQGRCVRFVAHGAGGLVVQAMAGQRPDLWKDLLGRGGRALCLGTPFYGCYEPFRRLLGLAGICRSLERMALGPMDFREFFRRLPGLLELIPRGRPDEPKSAPIWTDLLKVAAPEPQDLEDVKKTYKALDACRDLRGFLLIQGRGTPTPGLRYADSGSADFLLNEDGDGVVPMKLWPGDSAELHEVWLDHAALVESPALHPALLELLDEGRTTLLDGVGRAQDSQKGPVAETILPLMEDLQRAVLVGSSPVTREERQSLSLIVTHGSALEAAHPLVLGQASTEILGATSHPLITLLDARYQGRIVRRLAMGVFTGAEGSFEILSAPELKPPGLILIGLGREEIAPARLLETLCAALAKRALQVHEGERPLSRVRGWSSAAVSVHLHGDRDSVGPGVSLEQAVGLVVEAVLQVNEGLRAKKLWNHVRIDEVEFIEPHEDSALRCAHALRGVQGLLRCAIPEDMPLALPEGIRSAAGARSGGPSSRSLVPSPWRRVVVSGTANYLDFNLSTGEARARVYHHEIHRANLEQLLAEATQSSAFNPAFSTALRQLLLPASILEVLQEGTELVLNLDPVAARLPWELLGVKVEGALVPLSTKTGLLRELQTSTFRADPSGALRERALVIGDPLGVVPALPEAAREARLVAQVLGEAGWRVTTLVQTDGATILRNLLSGEFSLLHAAAHGRYNPKDPQRSGLRIGDDLFLTARDIAGLDPVPSLVFLNACHLGRVDAAPIAGDGSTLSPTDLAASLARELIAIGVRVVIAAGWAVNDEAGRTFALALYRAILSGIPLGRAVLLARQRAFEAHPDRNTFGAYQCYGDPNFVLRPSLQKRLLGGREVLDAVEDLRERLRTGAEAAGIASELGLLEEATPMAWRNGTLLGAFARCWAETGRWDEAIRCAGQALGHDDAPLGLLTELGAFERRLAARLRAQVPLARPEPELSIVSQNAPFRIKQIQEVSADDPTRLDRAREFENRSIARQAELAVTCPTSARHRALGDALLELAMAERREAAFVKQSAPPSLALDPSADPLMNSTATPPDRLLEAHRAYERAMELSLQEGLPDPVSFAHWAFTGFVSDKADIQLLGRLCPRMHRAAIAMEVAGESLEARLARFDILLLQVLLTGDPDRSLIEVLISLSPALREPDPGARIRAREHIEKRRELLEGKADLSYFDALTNEMSRHASPKV